MCITVVLRFHQDTRTIHSSTSMAIGDSKHLYSDRDPEECLKRPQMPFHSSPNGAKNRHTHATGKRSWSCNFCNSLPSRHPKPDQSRTSVQRPPSLSSTTVRKPGLVPATFASILNQLSHLVCICPGALGSFWPK